MGKKKKRVKLPEEAAKEILQSLEDRGFFTLMAKAGVNPTYSSEIKEVVDDMFTSGYTHGREEGFDAGYEDGYNEGNADGKKAMEEVAYEMAFTALKKQIVDGVLYALLKDLNKGHPSIMRMILMKHGKNDVLREVIKRVMAEK